MGRDLSSPVMSDKTILVSLEDLINMAMGASHNNKVNFKLIQTVLHILATQMRMLEQRVEITITEQQPSEPRETDSKSPRKQEFSTTHGSTRKSPRQSAKERDQEATRMQGDKAERAVLKDTERGAKTARQEQEKTSRAASKDRGKELIFAEKEERAASQDRERVARSDEKERQKEEEATSKENKKAEKVARKDEKASAKEQKEKERVEKEQEKSTADGKKQVEKHKKGKLKTESDASIVITEVKRDKQKILKVEKGPTTRTDARSRGSIEVVTQSQFDMLKAMVQKLAQKAGPLPTPALPDNRKLRLELARGTASLTDTMEAMQVSARVQAAEQAISRMGDLLTQLAATGALPEEIASKIDDVRQEMKLSEIAKVSETALGEDEKSSVAATDYVERPSVASQDSTASGMSVTQVTHTEMDTVIRNLREELKRDMYQVTAKTGNAADTALMMAKSIAEKMETAMQLDSRISKLHSVTVDYAEQLSGLDAGLDTQMQGFHGQMAQMRSELKQGLTQLEMVNTNTENAEVMELTERFEGLVSELDQTMNAHTELTVTQKELDGELHTLLESVEMLQEEKTDRDEILDGLRDKADASHLAGLLTEEAFAIARSELESRLEVCHDKFHRQDLVWMNVVKDLTDIMAGKAELFQLMSLRDEAQQLLSDLDNRCTLLAKALGDPKVAMATRLLSRDVKCGACMVPALIEPIDTNSGRPPALPPMLPRGAAHDAGDSCPPGWGVLTVPDDSGHRCHRWVGGSHTLLSGAVKRRQAGPMEGAPVPVPTNKYTGYGDDGRLYMLEEELLPCVECSKLFDNDDDLKDRPLPSEDGAGDRAMFTETLSPEPERKESMMTTV